MKRFALLSLLAVIAGVTAFAAAEGKGNWDRYAEYLPALFKRGLYIGESTGPKRVVVETNNKLSASRVARIAWDFPALGSVVGAVTCSESATASSPGSHPYDSCVPSTDIGADGGTAFLTEAQLTCRPVVDGVIFKLCVSFTDAGSYNPADSGYYGRTFSFIRQ